MLSFKKRYSVCWALFRGRRRRSGSCGPLVVDFLTRVVLMQMESSGKNRDIETVSRQLANALRRGTMTVVDTRNIAQASIF